MSENKATGDGAVGSARVCPKCGFRAFADRCHVCLDQPLMVTEVPCPDCYGGHFKPCQTCSDSGVAWLAQSPNAQAITDRPVNPQQETYQ